MKVISAVPLISLTVSPWSLEDGERLAAGLRQLTSEDTTLSEQTDPLTGQVVIGCVSERHLEIVIDRLKREFDVHASLGRPHVVYREALTRAADGEAKYAKQVEGRGQYGHVKLHLHPAERGTGHAVENRISGGAIPEQFIQAVEDGIRDALAGGLVAGYPIHDVRIELYDGSYHDVDSTDMAFRTAACLAVADGLCKAEPVLVEPVMRVEAAVPGEYRDDVAGNLRSRRGALLTSEDRGGTTIVRALVPLAELFGYDTDLRSRTLGRGTWVMELEDFRPLQRTEDDDDRASSVRVPRRPAPPAGELGIALPEPDDEEFGVS